MTKHTGINPLDVYFTKEQLDALDALFPEDTSLAQTANELYYKAGARDVIRYIRNKVAQVAKPAENPPIVNFRRLP